MFTVLSIIVRLCYALAFFATVTHTSPPLRTELGGAVGLGAAVGTELMNTRLSGSER